MKPTSGGLLFTLPREIRDQIYELTLVSTIPIDIRNFAEYPRHHLPHQKLGLSPAVLATSRLVHDEAHTVLYGLNTFRAGVDMHLHQALRRVEIQKALKTLRLSPAAELPEPDVFCVTDRPNYIHPCIPHIRRFEIHLKQVVPDLPHWRYGGINVDHTMQDLCKAFVEPGNLALFILSSDGCASMERWLSAAGEGLDLARGMEALMWQYHEWHCERGVLAASRQTGVFWLDSDQHNDRYSLESPSVFHPEMRSLIRVPLEPIWSRQLPSHFGRTGQLVRRERGKPRDSGSTRI